MSASEGGSTADGTAGAGPRPAGGPLALPAAGLRLAAALTARPTILLRRAGGWATELGRVGLGRSSLAPPPDDTRAGLCEPVLRRASQVVLATTGAVSALLDDAAGEAGSPLPRQDAERLRAWLPGPVAPTVAGTADGEPVSDVAGEELVAGVAGGERPTAGTAAPAAAEVAERVFTAPGPDGPDVPFDTGVRKAGGDPVPGRDVAATPGAVVARTPMFELLQYLPVTEQVHDTPVLVVPPLVHRYWLADLTPGFSLVEHLVGQGLQVFALSWRPAGPDDTERDLDAYVAAVLDALDACTRIARAPRVSLLGVRTGGLLTAAVQAHQAAIGLEDRVAAAGYLATVLDGPGPDPAIVRAAAERASRDGGRTGGPAGDDAPYRRADRAMRAWRADLLPLPASLHSGLGALAGGADTGLRVLGTPVRPAVLRRDGYLVTAADDPARSWTGGYRTARMLGGPCRLVLAAGDRAGAVIAPPRTATSFRVGSCGTGDGAPEAWLAAAERVEGSWWDDLAGWLAERAGTLRDAPPELGGRRLPPLFPAPGTYLTAAAGVQVTT